MYGRSWKWARELLEEWLEEQEKNPNAPRRVFRKGKKAIYTTIAALQREMPPARDMTLVRKVAELDRDLDLATERISRLEGELGRIRRTRGVA